jgi:hypothetical protein
MNRRELASAIARRVRALVLSGLGLAAAGCGGGIAHHPVGELAARSEARVDLVELAIADPSRAARVKALYLRVAQLRDEFDRERAAAWREAVLAPGGADFSEAARHVNQAGAGLLRRYAALMGEVRGLVSEAEFERLDALR